MEGVMDHTMRQLLSEVGGMNYLVSEFVRVTEYAIPSKTFANRIPELNNGCQTETGHPVHVQLLGSNSSTMSASASNAVAAGATHIDINFGCPAKRVNGHGGGSFLLQFPDQLYQIVKSIREAIPDEIPLSAKMRLGYEDENLLWENIDAISSGGAGTLTIHGRTKSDGYRPPARWEKIKLAKEKTTMTIIANGDIHSRESLEQCRKITGCQHFMIGRGSLNNPFLFQHLRTGKAYEYRDLVELMHGYCEKLVSNYDDFSTLGRMKQWCAHLRQEWPQIADKLPAIRKASSLSEMLEHL
jgi:tRNA-dihydrouridine synthase C